MDPQSFLREFLANPGGSTAFAHSSAASPAPFSMAGHFCSKVRLQGLAAPLPHHPGLQAAYDRVMDKGEGWSVVRREITGIGFVTHRLTERDDGSIERKAHCEDGWAVSRSGRQIAMLNGEAACCVVFNGRDEQWTTRMMPVTEAAAAIANGDYGDDAKMAPFMREIQTADGPMQLADTACFDILVAARANGVVGDVLAYETYPDMLTVPVGSHLADVMPTPALSARSR